ncbi:MAG: YkgJ family cysteine cluster protein [Acidimicrobiales bacterium]|nr:YkgJ family cysteine cluster protein [Acidimicrobiales bacterium]
MTYFGASGVGVVAPIVWTHDIAGSSNHVTDEGSVDAGRFSVWLDTINPVLRKGETSDVPCGSCTACCTSSQFVHIAPDEVDALAVIPGDLLFPAPRLPAGHLLMGYDEHGHCPMLIDGACSIYEHRPRTCRTYDCRVFAASGLELEDQAKSDINDRVRRWHFQLVDRTDRAKRDAVRSAAVLLAEFEPRFDATERTLAAIEIHDLFLAVDSDDYGSTAATPNPESVRVALRSRRGS